MASRRLAAAMSAPPPAALAERVQTPGHRTGAAASPEPGPTRSPGPAPPGAGGGGCPDLDGYCSALRSEVLRLHEAASGARSGSQVATRRAAAPPMEEQIASAMSRSAGAASTPQERAAPAASCGAMLELLLAKVVEAVMCSLEDTDPGAMNVMSSASKTSVLKRAAAGGTAPPSIAVPLVAALDRLRWLHEAVKAAGGALPHRLLLPTGGGTAATPPRAATKRTCGSQTDEPASPPPAQPRLPSKGQAAPPRPTRTAAVQVVAADLVRTKQLGVQVQLSGDAELPPLTVQLKRPEVSSVALQTETDEAPRADAACQAAVERPSRDSAVQTREPASSAANSTVRILRIARMERRATAAAAPAPQEDPPAELEERRAMELSASAGSDVVCGSPSGSSASAGCDPPERGLRLCASQPELPPRRRRGPAAAAAAPPGDKRRAPQLPHPPPLRCPNGHGMQWFRQPRADRGAAPHDAETASFPASCCVCAGTVAGPVGFHTCALCLRSTGEHHAICGACSRDPEALDRYLARAQRRCDGEAEAAADANRCLSSEAEAPACGGGAGRPALALAKSASAGAVGLLRGAPRPDAGIRKARGGAGRGPRAADWAIVSGAGKPLSPVDPVGAKELIDAALARRAR